MRLPLTLILLTVVSACGRVIEDEPPRPPGALAPGVIGKSSARLRLRVVESSAGVQVPIGFHDTELDVDCFPRTDASGVVRCLPDAPSTGGFSDPACTIPAIGVYNSCTPPRYASQRAAECAFGPVTFHEVKHRIDRPYAGGPAMCVPTSAVAFDVSYEVGAEDVSARFAAFTEQRRPLGRRFEQIVWVSADGAEWASGELFDRDLGLTCTPKNASDGQLRCLPRSSVPSAGAYADATCSKLLVAANGCTPKDGFALPRACGGFRSFRVTGPFEGATFEGRGDACVASTRPGPFLATEELLPDALAAIASEVGPSGVFATIVEERRIVSPHDNLRVPATGERCNLVLDAAGNHRCVPETPVVFADSECVRPVVVVAKAACSTPPKRAALFAIHPPESCTRSMQAVSVYEVGAEISAVGPAVYSKSSDGRCMGTSSAADYRLYEAKPLGLEAAPPWRVVTL